MAGAPLHLIFPQIRNPDLEFAKYANYLVALLERRARHTTILNKPFDISINPSNVCQLSCPYCATGNGTLQRSVGIMTMENHQQVLEPLLDELFIIRYFGTGETLLNKRFTDMVRETRQSEIFSYITTNLSLVMSDEQIDDLLTCGLGLIGVSLDGTSAQTYIQYRRGGDFDTVINNMQRLVQRKRELGLSYPMIEWRFLVFGHNQHEVATARTMAREIGVDILEFAWGLTVHNIKTDVIAADRVDLTPTFSGPAFDAAIKHKSSALHNLVKQHPELKPQPTPNWVRADEHKCDWLYFSTTAFPGQKVGPCCISNHEKHDFDTIGKQEDLLATWNRDSYKRAREFFIHGGPLNLLCGRCPQRGEQHKRFGLVNRAILRNAPPWVLKILATNTDDFFYRFDDALLFPELETLRLHKDSFQHRFPDIEKRMKELIYKKNLVNCALTDLMERLES